jgi:hypothetical protein
MKRPSPKPTPLAAQLLRLMHRFPDGTGQIVRSQLSWDQSIQPHILAHNYLCRLEFKLETYPKVYCLTPALSVLAEGRTLPHVYTRTEPICMCLFMRNRECWNDSMVLADVVIPLAFYWLAHFEEWLYSGVWRGGGTHAIKPNAPKVMPIFPDDAANQTSLPIALQN